jgi:hypothetical protein
MFFFRINQSNAVVNCPAYIVYYNCKEILFRYGFVKLTKIIISPSIKIIDGFFFEQQFRRRIKSVETNFVQVLIINNTYSFIQDKYRKKKFIITDISAMNSIIS